MERDKETTNNLSQRANILCNAELFESDQKLVLKFTVRHFEKAEERETKKLIFFISIRDLSYIYFKQGMY